MLIKIIILFLFNTVLCDTNFQNSLLLNFDNYTNEIGRECMEQLVTYFEKFLDKKMWAWKMFDASSKIPSGLLTGNLVDLGNFDECLQIDEKVTVVDKEQNILGKHCFLTIPLATLSAILPSTNYHRNSLQTVLNVREQTRVVNLGSPNPAAMLSICIPNGCSEKDFYFLTTAAGVSVYSCQTKADAEELNAGDWGCIAFFIIILLIMILSTAYDVLSTSDSAEKGSLQKLLVAFSVYTNGRKLISVSDGSNQLHCLNGIRFLSIVWVIYGHSYFISSYAPTINTLDYFEWMKKLQNMILIGATVSVDTFFLLGGLLMSYVFMLSREKNIKINIILYYVHRYIRLTPALAVLMVVNITILRLLVSGPLWPIIMPALRDNCAKYWWSILLYVQNYVNPEEQCIGQTWYLSVDMQLFIISPLILFPLAKWPRVTLMVLGVGFAASIISPFTIAYVYEIPAILPDSSANPHYLTEYYYNTYARFGPWLVGVIAGYLIYTKKENIHLNQVFQNKITNLIGWCLSIFILLLIIFGPNNMFDHDYNKVEASVFLGAHRVCWSVALAWMIYSCVLGHGGIVNWFLSLPVFQVLARLTYSMYLIHLTVQTIKIGNMRVTQHFSDYEIIREFWGDIGLTICISFIWTLAFESPMIIIEKVLFGQGKKESPKKSNLKT